MQRTIGIIRRGEQSFVRAALVPYELVPIESLALTILYRKGQCNQDALGTMLRVDKGRVAKIAAHLEERGLILRAVNENNRREKLVSLSPKGEDMIIVIDRIYDAWNQICFTGFTEEEMRQYQAFLDRIAENASKYRGKEKEYGQESDRR